MLAWRAGVIICSLIAGHLAHAIWFGGFRYGGAGGFAGPRDVTIRNVLRSYRPEWSEIERFSVERAGPWDAGYVHTRDCPSIPITGIQGQRPALFPKSRWAEDPINELNRLLEEARGGGAVGAAPSASSGTGADRPDQ
jgi:hypothetical protein